MNIDQIIEKAVRDNDLERLDALRDMFRQSDIAAMPYSVPIELVPEAANDIDNLTLDTEAFVAEPMGLRTVGMNLANRIEQARRTIAFNLKTLGNYQGLKLVSEGDSWFQYPFFLKDIVDHLSDEPDIAILSLGAAGDTMKNMADASDVPSAMQRVGADAVLFSGGGNDLLGEGRLVGVLRRYTPNATASDLLDEVAFEARLQEVAEAYRQILRSIFAARQGVAVFGHAYDLPLPDADGQWLGAAFAEKGIPLDIGREIVASMLNRFATVLNAFQVEFPGFHFVDLRGTVGSNPNSWHDEIHPKSTGFGRAADGMLDRIRQEVSAGQARSATLVVPVEPKLEDYDPLDPDPLSATTFSETNLQTLPVTARFERLVPFSSFAERARMARVILGYEARRVNGKLAVYYLPAGDGGGRYEVAGINERYHKAEADHLVALIESGRHDEAETYATEFIAGYTDRADRWCATTAVEFYLRDCMFNRGPGGSAWILQHAIGVDIDMQVGPITRDAVAKAERDPADLLTRLRASREVYERHRGRDESSRFWQGLVNRWNKAMAFAQSLLPPTLQAEASAIVPREPNEEPSAVPIRDIARGTIAVSRSALFEAMGDLVSAKETIKSRMAVFEGPEMAEAFAAGPSPEPRLNILGVGVGEKVTEGHMTGMMSVKVYVQKKFAKDDLSDTQLIAPEMDGIPVDIEEIGDLRPLSLPNPRLRFDVPVPGCSVGYDEVMAGTFGALLRDQYDRLHMLSNNHVLAREDTLAVGAPIFQQGRLDYNADGTPRQVGILSVVAPLGHNSLDAAAAAPLNGIQYSNDTLHIGSPLGTSDVYHGMELHKFGRTTRYTVGFVSDLAADVKINYPHAGLKVFENQIGVSSKTASPFSDRGDSGSLVMSRPGNLAVGLLFAGSPSTTFLNPIAEVLTGLNMELAL